MKGKGNARRPGEADLSAVARLRRACTQEEEGERGDPGFEQRFAAWFQREPARRVTWLAEVDGQLVGMMKLAISERMPRPGRMPGRWGYLGNAFVLAACQGQGIGGLLSAAMPWSKVSPAWRSLAFCWCSCHFRWLAVVILAYARWCLSVDVMRIFASEEIA